MIQLSLVAGNFDVASAGSHSPRNYVKLGAQKLQRSKFATGMGLIKLQTSLTKSLFELLPAYKPDWQAAASLTSKMRFVDPTALMHLSRGLTFDPLRSAEVLDAALFAFDQETGYVSALRDWILSGGLKNAECPTLSSGRTVGAITEVMTFERQVVHNAEILNVENEKGIAPAVFLEMSSPTLKIGMRVELPMRAVLLGNAPLADTYSVYSHVLISSDGKELTYYGITKRGWNMRFSEHTRSAVKQGSKRLFAKTMSDLIFSRVNELYGVADQKPKLSGLITVICGTGLSLAEALEAEQSLVERYSLASKHPHGLNMIPGGTAGVRRVSKFY